MDKDLVRKTVDAIEGAGITRFFVYSEDRTELLDVDSESTKAYFDDGNECVWFIRVSANVQPMDNRPMAFGCLPYEKIVAIAAPADTLSVKKMAESVGYEFTDELTEWIKVAGSQSGVYPVQSNPTIDEDGKPHLYTGIPTCTT